MIKESESATLHILRQLYLPDRFENLYSRIGPEIAKLLVKPEATTMRALEIAATAIKARGEGLFVPIYGKSGTGKTTLASTVELFSPSVYAPSVLHSGDVTFEALNEAVRNAESKLTGNDHRIIPLNIDHRESAPPSPAELASIKRFLRQPSHGARCLLFWPETDSEIAREIAESFVQITGKPAIELPISIQGPPRESWQRIAVDTLEITNNLQSIPELGIDPKGYTPNEFDTLGDFLREISNDFSRRLVSLLEATRRPVSLIVVFASATPNAGVLSQLTSHGHYGLVDGHALLDATRTSEVGKWWLNRRGLLTQVILSLNARAFCLPPTATISSLARFGTDDVQEDLTSLGIRKPGSTNLARDIGRTDLGHYLKGELRSAFESRGTPPATSTPAFDLISEKGFTLGRDKLLNIAVAASIDEFLRANEISFERITKEQKLDFCPLIPDNAIYFQQNVLCIEYTWRSGDYLSTRNRSEIAQYILAKLRNYARELGWVVA